MNSIIVDSHKFLFWLTVYLVGYIDMKLTDKLEGNLLSVLKSVAAK